MKVKRKTTAWRVSARKQKNFEKQKHLTRVGSGKLFAVSKTEIKRIHAAQVSFDVHRLENAFATGTAAESASWRPLGAVRDLPQYLSTYNIQQVQRCRMHIAVQFARTLIDSTPSYPLDRALLGLVRNSLIPTYLPIYFTGKCFANHRSRDSARVYRYLRVYTCVYTRRAKRAFTAFGGLYCKQIQ